MYATIRQVEFFLALAELGSFSKAARRVGLSQPAFSLSIQRLEDAMGIKLFQRTSRTVFLTSEGQAFLPLAHGLLQGWQSTFSQMSDIATIQHGRAAVAALPSLAAGMLPDIVARFAVNHPLVRLVICDVLHDNVVAMVRSGQVDFGISVEPAYDPDIVFRPLVHDKIVAILRKNHPLAKQETVSWTELNAEKLILMTQTTSVRQLTDRALNNAGVAMNIALEVDQLATISGLVQAGCGVSALPALCLPVVIRSDLTWRTITGPETERRLGLLLRRGQDLSLAADAFLAELHLVIPNGIFAAYRGLIRFEENSESASSR
ncbi:LysR family transcriptional regulator [Loktanella salsilacus]|uniref:LysR family transcriptional regulator n=1 Tax=Loktanella salsilacus TaxID=195913 RepID=UPI0020B8A3DB|nr:LysR family transcriptional regulator [Loktanella salsilacus]UTH46332.1 LysR family transcriptional regulator [Loktanella salsilacus]